MFSQQLFSLWRAMCMATKVVRTYMAWLLSIMLRKDIRVWNKSRTKSSIVSSYSAAAGHISNRPNTTESATHSILIGAEKCMATRGVSFEQTCRNVLCVWFFKWVNFPWNSNVSTGKWETKARTRLCRITTTTIINVHVLCKVLETLTRFLWKYCEIFNCNLFIQLKYLSGVTYMC